MSARSRRTLAVLAVLAGVALAGLVLPLHRALARLPDVEVRAVPRRVHAGRLRADAPVGQRFRCAHDGLHRIEVAVADPGPPGTAELELELRADGPGGDLLRTARTRAGRGFVAFDFEPLAASADRPLWLGLGPAAGAEVAARSPWLRYRGLAGAERPWGDRVLAGPVVADEVLVPHPDLRAIALAFEHLPAAPLAVELECAELGVRREATLVPPAPIDAGWAIVTFEPVSASRWTRWRLSISLPDGAALVGDAGGRPSLVTFHRAATAAGAPATSEALGGATRGGAALSDRDLVFRARTAPSATARLRELARAVGAALPLAALAWLAAAALSVAALVVPRRRAEPAPAERAVRRRETLGLAATALLLALAHHLLVPPWMGPDEPWLVEVAQYVAEGHGLGDGPEIERAQVAEHPYSWLQVRRRLPGVPFETIARVQAEILASMERHRFGQRVDWAEPFATHASFDSVAPGFTAVNHPPLWPFVASVPLRLARGLGVDARLRAVRALSGALYLGVVLATLALARLALRDAGAALLAGHLAAWYPVLARASATASNDLLAAALVAAAAVLAARLALARQRRLEPVLLGATCVAGLATKTTAALAPVLAFAALLARRERRPSRRALLAAGLSLGVLGALAWWLWARGHNTAVPPDLRAVRQRIGASLSAETWRALGLEVVGTFAWGTRAAPATLAHAVGIVAALAAPGLALVLLRPCGRVRRAVLALALTLLVGQVALVFLRGVASARYLLPAVPAAAVLLVAGHVAPYLASTGPAPTGLAPTGARRPGSAARPVLAALALLVLLWSGWSLWGGAVPAEHLELSG